jgi:hypothetical protein
MTDWTRDRPRTGRAGRHLERAPPGLREELLTRAQHGVERLHGPRAQSLMLGTAVGGGNSLRGVKVARGPGMSWLVAELAPLDSLGAPPHVLLVALPPPRALS